MSYYGDILRGVDERLKGIDKDFGTQQYKFAAEPKKGVKITHEQKYGTDKGDTSKSKIDMASIPLPYVGDVKGAYEFDKQKFTRTASNNVYSADGNKVNLALKHAWNPAKSEHVVTVTKKVDTADMGGVTAHMQSDVEYTHVTAEKDGKKVDDKFNFKPNLVLAGNDFKVGFLAEYCQSLTKMSALLTYNCSEGTKSYLEARIKDGDKHPEVAAGSSFKYEGWDHDAEVIYTLPKKTEDGSVAHEGFYGHPLTLRYACATKSGNTKYSAACTAGANLEVHNDITHQVDDHWTARFNQHFYNKNLGGEKSPVDVGLELSYKL